MTDVVDFPNTESEEIPHAGKAKKAKGGGFQSLNLPPGLFKAVMKLGYSVPTPIQRKTIPILLRGGDVVAMARTGSGKTAAFLIPCIAKLVEHSKAGIRAVILSPTRELAMQTRKFCVSLCAQTDLRVCLLVGGSSMNEQFEALTNEPDILIATPGRLMHHLIEVKMSLKLVEFLVFDEADRLFEMGFAFQIHEIMKKMSDSRQTALFSATLPSQLVEFTRAGLKNPEILRLDVDTKISPLLKIDFFTCRRDQKIACLLFLLKTLVIPSGQQAIIFCATRHHVELLNSILNANNLSSTPIYGQLDQTARKINIGKFRQKICQLLIVTDVAARGIDIPLLDNVINYDFPCKPKLFVHRVGRVARAGRVGNAFSLVAPDEMPFMLDLHLFLGREPQNIKKEDAPAPKSAEKSSTAAPTSEIPDNNIYYGHLPSTELGLEEEFVRQLIKEQSLERQMAVCTRAYDLYYRTRGNASNASVARLKELPSIKLHPHFLQYSQDSSETEHFLEKIHSFKGNRTIFEILDTKSTVMKGKRKIHQEKIQQKTKEKFLEGKRKSQEENQENENAAKEFDVELGSSESEQEEDEVDEEEQEDEEFSESSASENQPAKLRKSKAERKKEKKRRKLGDNGNSGNSAEEKAFADHLKAIEAANRASEAATANSGPLQAKNPSAVTGKKRYRDEKFFISDERDPNAVATEDALKLYTPDSKLGDFSLDLLGEDASGLLKGRQVQRWDQKKRNYVKVQEGGDPYKKQRNEAGELIAPQKAQNLFEKWQKKHRKGAASVRAGEAGEEPDNGEDGDENPKKKGKYAKKSGAPPKKRGGDDSFGEESHTKTPKKQGFNRFDSGSRSAKTELRSKDEVKKLRVQKEKNKQKNVGRRKPSKKSGKSGGKGGKGGGGKRK